MPSRYMKNCPQNPNAEWGQNQNNGGLIIGGAYALSVNGAGVCAPTVPLPGERVKAVFENHNISA